MQIEEKQVILNEQNIILRSLQKQDAAAFARLRDVTYRETYFLARYPEETDFTPEAAETMIADIAARKEESPAARENRTRPRKRKYRPRSRA